MQSQSTTRTIPLTQGRSAIVDAEDFAWLSEWSWFFDNGYAVRNHRSNGRRFLLRMHRAILRAPDGQQVDHVNGDRLDNRQCNLRFCTPSQNAQNRVLRADSGYGFKGVGRLWDHPYCARIVVHGKQLFLGSFDSPEDAARAYDVAAVEHFGAFARTNF